MRVESRGEQYDRIVGIWLGGAEILRTSTAEPNEDGIFWTVRKDITRYNFLLQSSNLTLSVMLENIINDEFTGLYNVTLTMLYYTNNQVPSTVPYESPGDNYSSNRKLGLLFDQSPLTRVNRKENLVNFYETPAELIIPIFDVGNEGFWFRIDSESKTGSKGIQIPPNTRKAIIEVYVSFHGNDEFWYQNPPDSYIKINNLNTGRGHGSYREVFVTVDDSFIGSVVPFPVIFTGGINPLFWEPVVSIGAFNLPSYDFDLTPFLGLLLDKKVHFFGVGVFDSISFWLVDANLHLWLDHSSSAVEAKVIENYSPSLSIKRKSKFKQLDGLFTIDAKRKSHFSGWVKSSQGNYTTRVSRVIKFKNSIKFDKNGTYKLAQQKVTSKTDLKVESETGDLISHVKITRDYPLRVITSTVPGSEPNVYTMVTNVSHSMKEKSAFGELLSSLYNVQDSQGWMLVKDHSVLSGSASTNQGLSVEDELGCYSRMVSATDGHLIRDDASSKCVIVLDPISVTCL